ncbi:MAG: peptide chain release factor N(5)-glutamine methyltransferase [Chakrabartia sp.]
MTLRDALKAAAARLAPLSATPRLDAELLAAHALGVTREAMILSYLEEAAPEGLEPLVARRLAQEPVAYILGEADFWTLTLGVSPAVLIPRADSETLIEAALDAFALRPPASILDLGTGSGALLLAALSEWPLAAGLGVDQSDEALAIARANAVRTGLAGRARFQQGDWGQGLEAVFDLILCNPPYIAQGFPLAADVAAHEPHTALFAGPDGLDDYRLLAPQIAALLAPGGVACVEIGFDQAVSAGALFSAQGLALEVRRDLGGRDRCLVLRKKA